LPPPQQPAPPQQQLGVGGAAPEDVAAFTANSSVPQGHPVDVEAAVQALLPGVDLSYMAQRARRDSERATLAKANSAAVEQARRDKAAARRGRGVWGADAAASAGGEAAAAAEASVGGPVNAQAAAPCSVAEAATQQLYAALQARGLLTPETVAAQQAALVLLLPAPHASAASQSHGLQQHGAGSVLAWLGAALALPHAVSTLLDGDAAPDAAPSGSSAALAASDAGAAGSDAAHLAAFLSTAQDVLSGALTLRLRIDAGSSTGGSRVGAAASGAGGGDSDGEETGSGDSDGAEEDLLSVCLQRCPPEALRGAADVAPPEVSEVDADGADDDEEGSGPDCLDLLCDDCDRERHLTRGDGDLAALEAAPSFTCAGSGVRRLMEHGGCALPDDGIVRLLGGGAAGVAAALACQALQLTTAADIAAAGSLVLDAEAMLRGGDDGDSSAAGAGGAGSSSGAVGGRTGRAAPAAAAPVSSSWGAGSAASGPAARGAGGKKRGGESRDGAGAIVDLTFLDGEGVGEERADTVADRSGPAATLQRAGERLQRRLPVPAALVQPTDALSGAGGEAALATAGDVSVEVSLASADAPALAGGAASGHHAAAAAALPSRPFLQGCRLLQAAALSLTAAAACATAVSPASSSSSSSSAAGSASSAGVISAPDLLQLLQSAGGSGGGSGGAAVAPPLLLQAAALLRTPLGWLLSAQLARQWRDRVREDLRAEAMACIVALPEGSIALPLGSAGRAEGAAGDGAGAGNALAGAGAGSSAAAAAGSAGGAAYDAGDAAALLERLRLLTPGDLLGIDPEMLLGAVQAAAAQDAATTAATAAAGAPAFVAADVTRWQARAAEQLAAQPWLGEL
jgi:hypothetical protein